jgi:hypothetical protein
MALYMKIGWDHSHYMMHQSYNSLLVMYDYGVASVFQQAHGNEDDVLGVI